MSSDLKRFSILCELIARIDSSSRDWSACPSLAQRPYNAVHNDDGQRRPHIMKMVNAAISSAFPSLTRHNHSCCLFVKDSGSQSKKSH